MAKKKPIRRKAQIRVQKQKEAEKLPFERTNYLLFGVGLLLIIVGYVALAQKPWNSFMSLTVAPILLVLGYCVVVPVAILYRKRDKDKTEETETAEEQEA